MTAAALFPRQPARAPAATYVAWAALMAVLIAAPAWMEGRHTRALNYRRRCAIVRQEVLRGWEPRKLDLWV